MKTKNSIILLLITVLLTLIIAGCSSDSGCTAEKQKKIDSSTVNQISEENSAEKPASKAAAPSPVIEKINAFLKKGTVLKESDVIAIYIRIVMQFSKF